jgi:ubiquinone/menaquinone biosynthesis C-methylase UbiE
VSVPRPPRQGQQSDPRSRGDLLVSLPDSAMTDLRSQENSRAYYDDFARNYDDRRGGRDPGGYHDLIDDLEVSFVERHARGADLLEVGCGTGLLLERFAEFTRSAQGVDLSPGMLEKARARGLTVKEGSATDLPYSSSEFDVACSFKVLAHVPDIEKAMSEMFRVVRPGGVVIAEFYNPFSIRALAKRAAGHQRIGQARDEGAVFTRFDSPSQVQSYVPSSAELVDARGIRIVTPGAFALKVPVLGRVLDRAERALCDSPLRALGGFYVVAYKKA